MRPLFKLFMLVPGACLCLGCAAAKDSITRAYHETLGPKHIKTDSGSDAKADAHVCLLDPAALIPQESSEPAADSIDGPCLELRETEYDFGSIREEEDYVHQFRIKNVGKAVLKIKKIVPG